MGRKGVERNEKDTSRLLTPGVSYIVSFENARPTSFVPDQQ